MHCARIDRLSLSVAYTIAASALLTVPSAQRSWAGEDGLRNESRGEVVIVDDDPLAVALGLPATSRDNEAEASSHATAARTDIVVTGAINSIELRIKDVPLRDVLTTFSDKYKFRLKMGKDLSDKRSGQFTGKLGTILSQLLVRENFALRNADGHLTLSVYSFDKDKTNNSDKTSTALLSAHAKDRFSLSPEGKDIAKRLFGAEARPILVEEKYLRAYAARAMRGNARRVDNIAHRQ
jgi:hypothetical protein